MTVVLSCFIKEIEPLPSPALSTPTEASFSTQISDVGSSSSGYVSSTLSISSSSSVPTVPVSVTEVPPMTGVSLPVTNVNQSAPSNLPPIASAGTGSTALSDKKDKPVGKVVKKERLPKIQLKRIVGLAEGTVVECSFDTYKNARITFRFGIDDDEPDEISTNMVSSSYFRSILILCESGLLLSGATTSKLYYTELNIK